MRSAEVIVSLIGLLTASEHIIRDLGMPDEDGYGFMHRVRSLQSYAGGNVPAIALTGFVRIEERMRALEAGYQMFVPKPVEADELTMIVSSLIQNRVVIDY